MIPILNAELLAIDIETKDVDLKTLGVGSRRKGNEIVGVAIGAKTPDGQIHSEYVTDFGTQHLMLQQIQDSGTPITGANLLYDLDWIAERRGYKFPANQLYDIQVAEPLINENQKSYSLNAIAKKYLGESKTDEELYQYCANAFGGKPDKSQAKNIWRCPTEIVAPYAKGDVELPLRIWGHQEKEMERQGLGDVFDLESRLQPLLLEMKLQGVPVDVQRTEQMIHEFGMKLEMTLSQLKFLNGGVAVAVWSANSIAGLFASHGLKYPLTPTGKPSFTKAFLENHNHPVAQLILEARQYDKMRGTFLENAILRNQIDGRIHCQFNQLRGDQFGTVTGRLSSSLPNLQQIPGRTDIGKAIRSLFIPEQGKRWYKFDYSQIEPRLLLSYARGREAERVIQAYRNDPLLDCYNQMMETMPDNLLRHMVKQIYLGATYGMGKGLMAQNLGMEVSDAEPHFEGFHDGAPYIKALSKRVGNHANMNGVVRTIGGRLRHFDEWESADFDEAKKGLRFSSKESAIDKFGQVRRAFTYKALNALIQGGAADVMKRAMVNAYEAGIFDVIGYPHLTVHDELDFSIGDTPAEKEGIRELQNTMESTYEQLRVKLTVDVERGANWGSVAGF